MSSHDQRNKSVQQDQNSGKPDFLKEGIDPKSPYASFGLEQDSDPGDMTKTPPPEQSEMSESMTNLGDHLSTSEYDDKPENRRSFLGKTLFGAWVVSGIGAAYLIAKKLREPLQGCLLYTSPSPRDATLSRMPSSA